IYSLIGAERAISQISSYEISLIIIFFVLIILRERYSFLDFMKWYLIVGIFTNLILYINLVAFLINLIRGTLKKIITLSTLRQLELIIIFLRFRIIAYYQLLVHAFFKSILFMSAKAVIHLIKNTQDIRYRRNHIVIVNCILFIMILYYLFYKRRLKFYIRCTTLLPPFSYRWL
ncbi:NADH-ubiquinone oxidoreductase chain 5, partial [Atta colombica]